MSGPESRRQFLHRAARVGLSVAGMSALGGCVVSPGQGRGGVPARLATVGYLPGGTDEGAEETASLLNNLREGLRELGWAEGENLRIEVRLTAGDTDALSDFAAEFVRIPVDVIVALGSQPIRAAAAATRTLPVVMVTGPADPVAQGLATSIQHPGGNVTGLLQPPSEIYGKRLELLVEAVPHVSRVAYLGAGVPAIVEALRETARTLGVQVYFITPRPQSEGELELAFATIDREAAEAVFVQPGAGPSNYQAQIIAFAARRQLPAMYNTRGWAEAGGLMSYGGNTAELHRRAAVYVDRILRGAKPGDLPIEYPTQYELVINLRTAAALGLTIPDAVLAQAAEVLR